MFTKRIVVALSAVMLAASAGPSLAEMKTKKVKASREQVRTACENSDGIGYGTEAESGGYGCVTDNGFIDCKENGDCVGGTVNRVSGTVKPRAPTGMRMMAR